MSSTAIAASPPDRGRYPWILIALLWLVAFLNAADRNILIAVLAQLKGDFGLSNSLGFTLSRHCFDNSARGGDDADGCILVIEHFDTCGQRYVAHVKR